MKWYTLEGLQELARDKGKTVCAWHPHPPVTGLEGRWCHDPKGRIKDYRKSDKWSTKIVVDKGGGYRITQRAVILIHQFNAEFYENKGEVER